MKSTAENPVPELPRALRSTFGKKHKRFSKLFAIYLSERPNEHLSMALSIHKAREIVSFDILDNVRDLKWAARRIQQERRITITGYIEITPSPIMRAIVLNAMGGK